MTCSERVLQWTETVSSQLPHLSRPQASVLALWSLGMVLAQSCGLSQVSDPSARFVREASAAPGSCVLCAMEGSRPLLVEGQRLAPCYSYALLNLSAVERLTGRLADALRWGDEGVRCNPDLALPHLYRAAALEALGRRDEAIDEARRTTDIDPQAVDAWMQQGRLLEQGERWADAAAAYDGALAADPTLTDAAMDAGVLYHYRLGDSARAAARYRAALAAVPTHYGAHYQLAIALFATGAEVDAVAAWRAFVPLAEAIGDQASLARAPARLRELAAPRSS